MTKIYFLKNFEEKFKGKIEDGALVYPLDYKSLYILKNNKIKFDLIDNFLNDNDGKELFQTCRNIWNEFTNISKKERYVKKKYHKNEPNPKQEGLSY